MSPVRTLWGRRELLGNLVAREMKSRYKGSFLGLLWSLLTPLFMAVIYVFFLRLLSRGVPVEQIIIGVFAWTFTVQAVQSGMESITGNSNLVKKVFFPRMLLPVSTTLAALVNFLLSLIVQFPIVILLLLFKDGGIDWRIVFVPLIILYQTLFNTSLAMLFGAANVYFRDTRHLVGVFLSAWFFMSPAMYHLGFVEAVAADAPWIMKLYMLNPMAGVITAYRAAILSGVNMTMDVWALAGVAWPVILMLGGYAVFKRAQRNFADML